MTCYIEIVCLQKIFKFNLVIYISYWPRKTIPKSLAKALSPLSNFRGHSEKEPDLQDQWLYIYLSVICIEQRIQLMTSNYILKRDDLQGEKYGLRIDLCGTP